MNDNKGNDLICWWQTPLGQHVLAQEQASLDSLSASLHGYFQLQLGGGEKMLPTPVRPACQLLLSPEGDVSARPEALPFKNHSIDNILMPHVLEFAADPHQVLREVERVLAADGKLVLCSFNPVSLWGLRRLFSWQDAAPWHGHFFTQTRIRDWLALLNFEVTEQHRILFSPPFSKQKWLAASRFSERWGKRLWPWLGGVSVIVATKRTIPLTPLRQEWLNQRLFPTAGLVNKPITRNNSTNG